MEKKYKEALDTIMNACKTVNNGGDKCPIFNVSCCQANCPLSQNKMPEFWNIYDWTDEDKDMAYCLKRINGHYIKKDYNSKFVTVFDVNGNKVASICGEKVFKNIEANKVFYLSDIH